MFFYFHRQEYTVSWIYHWSACGHHSQLQYHCFLSSSPLIEHNHTISKQWIYHLPTTSHYNGQTAFHLTHLLLQNEGKRHKNLLSQAVL